MSALRPLFGRQAKPAFVVACLVLLVSGVGFTWAVKALNVYLRKLPVEIRGSLDTMPRVVGRWQAVGKDRVFDEAMIEELGTNIYLDREYAVDGDMHNPRLLVHVSYYTGMIDAVPHVPDRCLVAAGFNAKTLPQNLPLIVDQGGWTDDPEFVNMQTGLPYRRMTIRDDFLGERVVRMPQGDLKLRITEFEREDQRELRIYGGYLFIANGQATATPEGVKAMAFRPSEKYAYYCKVQLIHWGRDTTQDGFVRHASEFLSGFIPELMQRLPDWAEVERRDVKTAAKTAG